MKKEVIKTNHVYQENAQVFLKKGIQNTNKKEKNKSDQEWFPINFQWIPIVELQKNLKMKKIIISLTLLTLIVSSCTLDELFISGEGAIVTQEITLDDFKGIKSLGSSTVIISKGAVQKVEVTGHANIIERVKRNVTNEVWTIELENGNYRNSNLTYKITLPILNKAIIEGSGEIIINDFESSENVTLKIMGSGNIETNSNIGCENLNVIIEGSGNLSAKKDFLNLNKLSVDIYGSGSYFGFENKTSECDIYVDGSGDCNIFASEQLNVKIKGSGDIRYKGQPAINSDISGSGKIIDKN
jgi:hypothetical protein